MEMRGGGKGGGGGGKKRKGGAADATDDAEAEPELQRMIQQAGRKPGGKGKKSRR